MAALFKYRLTVLLYGVTLKSSPAFLDVFGTILAVLGNAPERRGHCTHTP